MADIKRIPIGPLGTNVANNLRRIREQRHMTYTELVKQLAAIGHPIPILGVRRIERRERRVDADDLACLAAVLGVDPWALTQPPQCDACNGAPPAGFTCNACGTSAVPSAA
ncbi:hypothetical protein O7627_24315 [Solwaraspora sp. WMMD1047]|uniref:hypothetical protein n=1 Tax=Solwaraspora sp. WMMD1047 TaxID=3016102 RepID=UPI00241691F5|nr:hypothetical protein [Solwaraspora sp. WMMD1047]MDG4832408.1 hypothetical protein [Solwaraspora sp. WMMD1047]